ncbi:GlcG/HbpS family heme-binding protein [Stakelama tenebrarum]|uniref:Heme-binding protein n=1 Tax=Stakelama tenebrarum TaxID=2711215 RepID=A0A6G6Y1Y7_9SPHN|nr:heme-binding protein [Sphingosinithalassobacter tenebrarum]QIG78851.1 heme-binding protein [Sphingosinithalassobacter tenebrarum]
MHTKPVLGAADIRRMLDAAWQAAEAAGHAMSIAFADDGGYPLALQRMDGAGLMTGKVAMEKARTAALLRAPSAVLQDRVKQDPALLALTDYLPMAGGVPIRVDDAIVGAVGISGGTPEQDGAIAAAALAAL